jgi:hypothetical protein
MSTVPYTFAGQTGSIPLNELDTNFANVKAFANTSGYVTANAQANINSVGILTSLSVSGNITGGTQISVAGSVISANVLTGQISATSNITGGNILTSGRISATGSVTGGNFNTAGIVNATGNIIGGNLLTSGVVSTSGSMLASGRISATGNINGGNIVTSGKVDNTGGTFTNGNITIVGGNIISAGTLFIDPNGPGFNDGNVVITGNLTVQGTTTTINSVTVTTNDLFINVANNASTSSAANGGGLGVGPIGAEYATWAFNNAATAWYSNIAISAAGTVTGANILTAGVLSVGGKTTLAGVATAPTAANGTSNTQVATTAFVGAAVYNATASLGTMSTQNANAVTITGGTISGLGAALPAPSGGTGLTSPGTSGNVLQSNGTSWTSAALPAAISGLGYGGSVWHDVTSSRSQGVTYYNTHGYPIQVSGNFGCNGGGQGYIYIDGVLISLWQAQFNGCGGFSVNMPCIVPTGSSYQLANMGGGARGWYELY